MRKKLRRNVSGVFVCREDQKDEDWIGRIRPISKISSVFLSTFSTDSLCDSRNSAEWQESDMLAWVTHT